MMRCLLILSGQQVKRNIQLQNILVLSGVLVHLNTVVTLMVIYQCTCDISRFYFFLIPQQEMVIPLVDSAVIQWHQ